MGSVPVPALPPVEAHQVGLTSSLVAFRQLFRRLPVHVVQSYRGTLKELCFRGESVTSHTVLLIEVYRMRSICTDITVIPGVYLSC